LFIVVGHGLLLGRGFLSPPLVTAHKPRRPTDGRADCCAFSYISGYGPTDNTEQCPSRGPAYRRSTRCLAGIRRSGRHLIGVESRLLLGPLPALAFITCLLLKRLAGTWINYGRLRLGTISRKGYWQNTQQKSAYDNSAYLYPAQA
jgi:hypothetical protein